MYLDESRGKCKNLPGLIMVLVKRRTRPKKETPLAERELLPERPRPSTEKLKAYSEKQAAAKVDARQRLANGRPVIWPHPGHPTQEERKRARREVARGRRKIDKLLSSESYSPRGRKADAAYDRAAYQVRVAQIAGKKISVSDLTHQHLPTDKSVKEDKLDKMKQALKRRR
jgi:hypothetical protein